MPTPPRAQGLSAVAWFGLSGLALATYINFSKAKTSREWMQDLQLAVLMGCWWITWPSLIPIRQLPKMLRDISTHTSQPLQGFRSMIGLK